MATIEQRQVRIGEREDGSPLFKPSYRVKIRIKDFPPQTATFDRRADAKEWASRVESEIRESKHFPERIVTRKTFAELADHYVNEQIPADVRRGRKNEGTASAQKRQLDWWKARLGHLSLSQIDSNVIEKAMAEMELTKAQATVAHYLAPLSRAFHKGVKLKWIRHNPVEQVDKPEIDNVVERFLSKEEREALLTVCRESESPMLHLIVLIALSTGARKEEILSLRWTDINFELSQITLHKTKNGEVRTIPIMAEVKQKLTEHSKIRRIDSLFVFPGTNGKNHIDIRSAWETARERAKLENFRFHDLRHSCASYLAMSGASTHEIMAVLGHKSAQMVKRYAHIGEQHTATVLDRMAEKFLQNTAPKKATS